MGNGRDVHGSSKVVTMENWGTHGGGAGDVIVELVGLLGGQSEARADVEGSQGVGTQQAWYLLVRGM